MSPSQNSNYVNSNISHFPQLEIQVFTLVNAYWAQILWLFARDCHSLEKSAVSDRASSKEKKLSIQLNVY